MGDLSIRFAKNFDIERIMGFINCYWKKGHILAVNKKVFEWQYCMNEEDVNFVIGEEKGDIKGILGFVPYRRERQGDYSLALWKTISSSRPFMGVELLMFLKREGKAQNIICPGINMKTTERLYRLAGMYVGQMIQWYRLNHLSDKFVIGKIPNKNISPIGCHDYNYRQYTQFEQLKEDFCFEKTKGIPDKTEEYFFWRYFNHPSYEYIIFGIYKTTLPADAIVVLRIQEYLESKVIRFVDYIGDVSVFPMATVVLDKMMEDVDAEYVDMYEAGIDENILLNSGWKKVDGSGNIIPNYFAPYEQSNIDIYYSSSTKNAVLFRGDGDQDRPN